MNQKHSGLKLLNEEPEVIFQILGSLLEMRNIGWKSKVILIKKVLRKFDGLESTTQRKSSK